MVHLINLVQIENGFGRVTDDKDEDDAGEDRGHGVVPPVGAAGGHRHQGHVVRTCGGHDAVDQPVQDGQH